MDHTDPIPVSALQHWAYCPRQCGLIHLEQAFDENLFTLRGRAVHAQVDQPGVELRKGLRVERALPIWSDSLGLIGKADTVEFEPDGTPYPVEYKQGSRNKALEFAECDDLQLAAQAICLEEMTGRAVTEGALYYATTRRRRVLSIDRKLRDRVVETTRAIADMLESRRLPLPTPDRHRCVACSLHDRCQPEAIDWSNERRAPLDLFDPDR
ncbi:MAG TPA: CRISPR-associated protein Cas4 [Rhodocyclaceae bacterium]|jgi:CRISPR-associated exonuclease Cas4|nr:CRISPR-associated protein Cas4 [Rhodocyclaceae bacterium]